jgi:hypothetical protein
VGKINPSTGATKMKTTTELAMNASQFLYRDKERDLVLPVANAPQWFTDLCRTAHSDFPPDDWRYEFIQDALYALAEDADAEPDLDSLYPYTKDRLNWLASSLNRSSYCDDAASDYGWPTSTDTLIAYGMQRELEEVFTLVRQWLEERAEEEAEAEAAEGE